MELRRFGHQVTIATAENVEMEISSVVTLQEGFEEAVVVEAMENAIREYFLEIKKEWESTTSLIVRIAHIESRILNVNGVVDVSNTKINNSESNLVLTNEQIPHLSGVILNA